MGNYKIIKTEIDATLASLFSNSTDQISQAMHYALTGQAKRIRPVIACLLIEGYGLSYKDYLFQILSLEMIHTYSLIHDDLPCMDDDDYRRNRKTCHVVYGEAFALLAGDALLTYAFESAAKGILDAQTKLEWISLLSKMSGYQGMIYGQMLDIQGENQVLTIEELKEIHKYKTGCLINASFKLAGLIIKKDIDILSEIGNMLGLAFQIQDDILDVTGDSKVIGKPINSDIKNNKSTYVSLMGIEKAQSLVDELFLNIQDQIACLQLENADSINALIKDIKNRNR